MLHDCEGVRVIADDIIVFGSNVKEHDVRLEKVLATLCSRNLTLNPDKCKFGMEKLIFMGHVLSKDGIQPTGERVKAVNEAKRPETVNKVRSFLGLVNYCGRFINNLSTIEEPLRRLTRKNVNWAWGSEQERSFQELKKRLTCSTSMAYFNPVAYTQVIVDASPVGLGAILVQKQGDGCFKPVIYTSRSLTDVERRYSQTEKEALAVVWACERFRLYVMGIHFELITDHKPLEIIYSPKSKPPLRIERWALRLQPFDFQVKYKPGKTNAADALSRLPLPDVPKINLAEEYVYFVTKYATPVAITTWGSEQERSFQELKKRLTCSTSMAYFNPVAYTQVIVDASPVGLGAILVQKQGDGCFKPVIYASRSLTDVERRYSQTEKEALAVVWACERFRLYVMGIHFELITDHKPLEIIYSPKSKPPLRIERWALRLQPFDFQVKYKPGKTNAADALSRLPLPDVPKINLAEEYVYFVTKYATPVAITTREIEQQSGVDAEMSQVRRAVNTGKWDELPDFKHVKDEITLIGCLLLRGQRIIIPKSLRKQILDLAHEGHQGIVKCKSRLRGKVWWPGIDKEVEHYVKNCKACLLMSSENRPEPLNPTPLPDRPWQHIAVDICGPLPSGESLLVAVDYYSRWFEIAMLYSTSTAKVVNCLDNWFTSHGLPELIVTDNGVQFTSSDFAQFLNENGIDHRKVTPYYPQANGEVERQNRTIMKAIKTIRAEGGDWRKELNKFLKAYRSTPHSVTRVSPAELMYGRKMRTKLPEISLKYTGCDEEVRSRDRKYKEKGKEYHDHKFHVKEGQVEVGDVVVLQQRKENKLSSNFLSEPYKVIEKKGNSVQIESTEGVQKRRNVIHMKKMNFANNREKSEYWDQCKEHDIGNESYDIPENLELNLNEIDTGQEQTNVSQGPVSHNDSTVSNTPIQPICNPERRSSRVRKPPRLFKRLCEIIQSSTKFLLYFNKVCLCLKYCIGY